jgi:quinol monooxygenase YgiN
MIVRMTQVTVDPEDVAAAVEAFTDKVRPAFDRFDGCEGIEMHVGTDEHSGDRVDLVTISRWDSREALDAAESVGEYGEAMEHIRPLFHQSPIVHHFQPVE